MITIFASVAVLPVLWFVWIKFQQTRWRQIADDLYFGKFEELKTVDFDSLVEKVGQPFSVEERRIDGHLFVIGWRVDKPDAFPRSIGGVVKIDDNDLPKVWSGQKPWIEEVQIRGYVDYVQLVPFHKDYHYGSSINFLRKKDGSLSVIYPSQEFQEETINRDIAYLSGLLPENSLNQVDDTPNPKMLAMTCADATEKTKGYWSRVVIKDDIEWFFGLEKPNSFLVTQIAGEEQDLLITVGADTYRYIGCWIRMPNEKEDAPEFNQRLVIDQYLEVLRTGQPVSIRACRFSEQRPWLVTLGKLEVGFGVQNHRDRDMTLIEFDVKSIGENCLLRAMGNGPWHITFWIDAVTNLIARVDAVTEVLDEDGDSYEVELKQVFAYVCPSVSPPDEHQEFGG